MKKNEIYGYEPLVDDLKELIHKKQYQVIKLINSETINLYWEIGEEIYRQQQEKGWGKSIVQVLSVELQKEFPGAKGYSAANLWRMRNFYLTYRNSEKLAPMVREISWSNNIIIMEKCKDDLQREFYIQMTKRYGWTKRVLTNFVEAQTYEKYLLNQTNFDLVLPVEQRVQAKLSHMLSRNLDMNQRRRRGRKIKSSLDLSSPVLNIDSVSMEVIEELLVERYGRAKMMSNDKVQKALFDTLADICHGFHRSNREVLQLICY